MIVALMLSAFTKLVREITEETPIELPKQELITFEYKPEVGPINIKGLDEYLHAVGHRESGNRYKIVNRFGYLGKYQFGRRTLNQLGFRKISNKEFLNTPEIQEKAMMELLKHNKHIMRKYIAKYDGTVVRGISVTESGILAATHLAGPRAVKRFLKGGKDKRDGLGTPLSSYLRKFSGYELNL